MAAPTTAPNRTPTPPPGGGRNDPFAPSVANFFQEPSRVQRLDLLYALIGYGHSPLLLIGPPGAGKTTLLLQLQKRLARTQPTALLSAYPELAADPLLDEAQRQFTAALAAGGLEGAAEAALLIDNADTLSDVVLQVLLTPASGQGAGQVRVLLTGTPGLVQRIAAMTSPIINKVLELLPFSEEDSAHFVRSRLAAAGIHNHPLLLPAALKRLYRDTGGWPGAIVTHTRTALTPTTAATAVRPGKTQKPTAPKKNAPPVTPHAGSNRLGFNQMGDTVLKAFRRAVRSYWLWPVVGVSTLAILFGLWPKEVPTLFPSTTGPSPSLSTLPPPPVRPTSPPLVPTPETPPTTAAAHEPPVTPPAVANPMVEPVGPHPTHPAHPIAAVPPRETVTPPVVPPPVATSTTPAAVPPTPPTAHTVPTAQVQTSAPSAGPAAPHPVPMPPSTSPASTQTPATPTVATNTTPPPTNPAPSGNLKPEEWLRAQRPTNYTMQLMGGNAEAPLQEFLRRWGLAGEMVVAHTRRSGHDWYALLYGVYPNSRQAQEATKQLPHGIGKPWIRTFGSVQQDLQQSNTSQR
ncbi:DamX protein [Gammaproteobacteria bacterium]